RLDSTDRASIASPAANPEIVGPNCPLLSTSSVPPECRNCIVLLLPAPATKSSVAAPSSRNVPVPPTPCSSASVPAVTSTTPLLNRLAYTAVVPSPPDFRIVPALLIVPVPGNPALL